MQELPNSGCACSSVSRASTCLTQQAVSSGGLLADSSALSWPCMGAKAQERVRLLCWAATKVTAVKNSASVELSRQDYSVTWMLSHVLSWRKQAHPIRGWVQITGDVRWCLTNEVNGWPFWMWKSLGLQVQSQLWLCSKKRNALIVFIYYTSL